MLRYKVVPKLQIQDGTVYLGCKQKDRNHITHTNLGILSEQGPRTEVLMGFNREVVTGIFGQRGSGKSYTLGTIVESLGTKDSTSNIGFNDGQRAVLVLDTLNIYQYTAVPVSKIPDPSLKRELSEKFGTFGIKETEVSVSLYYPAGYRQNFYSPQYKPFALDTSFIKPEDYAHIFQFNLYKDPAGHLLLAMFDAVKFSGYIYHGEQRSPSANAGISELIEFLSDEQNFADSFDYSTVRALRSRLETLRRDKLFSSSPTSLSSILKSGEIAILMLGRLSPPMRSLTAAIIVRQLFNLRATASEANKTIKLDNTISDNERKAALETLETSPPRTLVCIDEAHGYAPPTKENPSTSVLIQFVKEGRNHGLSLMITSQQPSAIHSELLSQIDCVISHKLTVQSDINSVIQNSKGRSPDKISSSSQSLSIPNLLRELSQGQAYISHGDASRSFVVQVRPRITAHGGIES